MKTPRKAALELIGLNGSQTDCKAISIGRRWMENSSLESWFPFTSEELKSLKSQVSVMRDALEHCLEASSDPPKYGRYLSREDRDIIRDALSNSSSRRTTAETLLRDIHKTGGLLRTDETRELWQRLEVWAKENPL